MSSYSDPVIPLWRAQAQPPLFAQNDLSGWLDWRVVATTAFPAIPVVSGTVETPRRAVVVFCPFVLGQDGIYEGFLFHVAKMNVAAFLRVDSLKLKACLMTSKGAWLDGSRTAMPDAIHETAFVETITFGTARSQGSPAGAVNNDYPTLMLPFFEPCYVPAGFYWIQLLAEVWYGADTPSKHYGFTGVGGFCRPTLRHPGSTLASGFYLRDLQRDAVNGLPGIPFCTSANTPDLSSADPGLLPVSATALTNLPPSQTISLPSGYGELHTMSPALLAKRLY